MKICFVLIYCALTIFKDVSSDSKVRADIKQAYTKLVKNINKHRADKANERIIGLRHDTRREYGKYDHSHDVHHMETLKHRKPIKSRTNLDKHSSSSDSYDRDTSKFKGSKARESGKKLRGQLVPNPCNLIAKDKATIDQCKKYAKDLCPQGCSKAVEVYCNNFHNCDAASRDMYLNVCRQACRTVFSNTEPTDVDEEVKFLAGKYLGDKKKLSRFSKLKSSVYIRPSRYRHAIMPEFDPNDKEYHKWMWSYGAP